jgi:hypothetical protein
MDFDNKLWAPLPYIEFTRAGFITGSCGENSESGEKVQIRISNTGPSHVSYVNTVVLPHFFAFENVGICKDCKLY